MLKFSLPTKAQWVHTIVLALTAFVSTGTAIWIKQPNPFSQGAVLLALSAGAGAVIGLLKGFLTTV